MSPTLQSNRISVADPSIYAAWLYPVSEGTLTISLLRSTPFTSWAVPRQVHGTKIAVDTPDGIEPALEAADGVVSGSTSRGMVVQSADCVPLLAYDSTAKVVGAVHAGWRGLSSGAIDAWIDTLLAQGASAETLSVMVGPHARSCCYEIDNPDFNGPAVAPSFIGAFGDAILERSGKTYLDQTLVATTILARRGVTNVTIDPRCTIHDASQLPSWRRDHIPGQGRAIVGVIGRLP